MKSGMADHVKQSKNIRQRRILKESVYMLDYKDLRRQSKEINMTWVPLINKEREITAKL